MYINGSSYVTLTFYPTQTTYNKVTQTLPVATTTTTRPPRTPTASAVTAPVSTVCQPGDARRTDGSGLMPTKDQATTLYVLAICPSFCVELDYR